MIPFPPPFRVLAASLMLGLWGASSSQAAITLTLGTLSYQENFDSYLGTEATVPAGWTVSTSQPYLGIDDGSNANPGNYALGGNTDPSERSLGILTNGSGSTFSIDFNNATGQTITNLLIQFNYEQWSYRNNSGFDLSGTGALAGNLILNFGSFSGSNLGTNGTATPVPTFVNLLSLTIPNGASFGLQFQATDDVGIDNSVSIDDFSLTATTAVPEPSVWCFGVTVLLASQARKLRRRP